MRAYILVLAAVAGLGVTVGTGAAAWAQSVSAPAGTAPATEPGGTMGRAGPRNLRAAIRSGEAYRVGRRGRVRRLHSRRR